MPVILRALHFASPSSPTWVSSYSQDILASRKLKKLQLPSQYYLRGCVPQAPMGPPIRAIFVTLSTMALHCQAKCQAPLRQLILFPGYSLESQAQLTFSVILPSLLGGPIIVHSLQPSAREIGCWKQSQ